MSESHGALVGWVHHEYGDRVMLRLETVDRMAAVQRHEPDQFRVLMSKQQAAVLGTYLLQISGQTPADPADRGLFKRLFG